MGVTIKEIAKVCRVDVATVSRALNGKGRIGKETINKIKDTAEVMGYVKNQNATALVKKMSNKIGVFLVNKVRDREKTYSEFVLKILNQLVEEARKKDVNILIFSEEEKEKYLKSYKGESLRGAIFFGLDIEDECIKIFEKSNLNIVSFDSKVSGDWNNVMTDSYSGVIMGLKHLYENNHRRIGIISGHKRAFINQIRTGAVTSFLREKNMLEQCVFVEGDFTFDSGYQGMKEIIQKNINITGVFCFSDAMAYGAWKYCKENGIKIPSDISIVGFDNIEKYNELTSIEHNYKKISEEILNLIMEKRRGEKVLIEAKIIEKESVIKIKI